VAAVPAVPGSRQQFFVCYGPFMLKKTPPQRSAQAHWQRWTCLALTIFLLGGCGYYSSYVPPDHTRSRVTWEGDHLTVLPASDLKCAHRDRSSTDGATTASPWRWHGGYWAPFSHSKWVTLGLDPFQVRRHQKVPQLSLVGTAASSHGGGDLDEAFLILAAVAVAASNLVAIGLAAAPAEDSRGVAEALDLVNSRNDRLRLDAAHCLSFAPEATP
jgi:hypothetical protein